MRLDITNGDNDEIPENMEDHERDQPEDMEEEDIDDEELTEDEAAEFSILNQQLDQLDQALDAIDQKNDSIHSKLLELLEENRQARKEIAENSEK